MFDSRTYTQVQGQVKCSGSWCVASSCLICLMFQMWCLEVNNGYNVCFHFILNVMANMLYIVCFLMTSWIDWWKQEHGESNLG